MTDQTDTPALEEKPQTEQPRAEVKPVERPRKRLVFVTWVHRHHRTFTISGALIVFVTFIVKDGIRDQLKDVVESVDKAEGIYLVRADVHDVSLRLDALEQRLLWRDKNPWSNFQDFEDIVIKHTDFWNRDKQRAFALDNIARFVDKLRIRSLDSSLRDEIAAKHEKLVKELATASAWWKILFPIDENAALRRSEEDLDNSMNKLALSAIEEARKVQARDERRYTIATWVSYFLYGIGWGLALVGRLYGVETGAGE